jgi:hypothetical protein
MSGCQRQIVEGDIWLGCRWAWTVRVMKVGLDWTITANGGGSESNADSDKVTQAGMHLLCFSYMHTSVPGRNWG